MIKNYAPKHINMLSGAFLLHNLFQNRAIKAVDIPEPCYIFQNHTLYIPLPYKLKMWKNVITVSFAGVLQCVYIYLYLYVS